VIAGGAGGAATHWFDGSSTSASSSAASTLLGQPVADTGSGALSISEIAAKVLPSVVEVTETLSNGTGIGSGVILSADGEILTNNHVVSDVANGGGTLTVTFSDGKTATATVVGTDPDSDLAIIKAQGVSGLTPATLGDSSTVKVGDEVVAIGSPEGLQDTVTSGIVSYLNRQVTVQSSDSQSNPYSGYPFSRYGNQDSSSTVTYNAIQTDASINPGNSGGPLLNDRGEVIGINSAMYSPTSAQGSEGGSVGLGFAIPINQAKKIISELQDSASQSTD
jgi:putative serine protease PepD